MRDIGMATLWLDNDIQELQHATAAFLSDQYENGEYIASSDDIAELQKATEAFLVNRSDGECFYLDIDGQGLLLPGEQFLLPAPIATNRAQAAPSTLKNTVELIDGHLHAHMSYEDDPHKPVLDTAFKTEENPQVYTSFDKALGSKSQPETPSLDEQSAAGSDFERANIATVDVLRLPDEVDRLLGICDDSDNDDIRDGGGANAVAASYAGFFYDPLTDSYIPYTSLDELLDTKGPRKGLLSMQQGYIDDPAETEARVPMPQGACINDSDASVHHNELAEGSHTLCVVCDPLEVNMDLSTILEEDEPVSATSDCPTDFTDWGGSVKPLAVRQNHFQDDKHDCIGQSTPNPCSEEALGVLDELFTADIWGSEPNLGLNFPADVVHDVELDLLEALATVFEVIRSHFWADLFPNGSDYKHKAYQLIGIFQDFVSPGRLRDFVNLAVGHLAAVDGDDATVLENRRHCFEVIT